MITEERIYRILEITLTLGALTAAVCFGIKQQEFNNAQSNINFLLASHDLQKIPLVSEIDNNKINLRNLNNFPIFIHFTGLKLIEPNKPRVASSGIPYIDQLSSKVRKMIPPESAIDIDIMKDVSDQVCLTHLASMKDKNDSFGQNYAYQIFYTFGLYQDVKDLYYSEIWFSIKNKQILPDIFSESRNYLETVKLPGMNNLQKTYEQYFEIWKTNGKCYWF